MDAATIQVEIHPKFRPLFPGSSEYVEHTYASIYGGRYGMKSEQVHKIAALRGISEDIRVCNARETMSSIKDSSHKVLSDNIHAYGMARSQNGPYEIQEQRIIRRDGARIATEFIFIGIREDVRTNKSLKDIDLTIVEEAAKVSKDSWDVLIPTVIGRKPGSKLWLIWNPELTTDDTWSRFMDDPPSNTIRIETSYLDNPWLTEEARVLIEDTKRKNYADYEHIFLGKPKSNVTGAIYGEQMKAIDEEGRVCRVPYDRTRPVDTFWDLGYGDKMAIWFAQSYGGWFNFIDYLEDNGKTIHEYVVTLRERPYVYGKYWVPHDALDLKIHKRLAGDRSKSIESILRSLVGHENVRLVAKAPVADGINAVRMFLSDCRFDEEKCRLGLQALRTYQWGDPDKQGMTKREPLHNSASHGADAFRYSAYVMKHEMPQKSNGAHRAFSAPASRDAWMG